jgi:hypothetical protein
VAGILFFFVMEKFLYWRHCMMKTASYTILRYLNLIGDGVHNFIDGMLIAAGFIVSASLGYTTTLAVVFHEIPQELGDYGVLLYGGFGTRKALGYNFLSATTAIVGAVVTYLLVEGSKVQMLAELLVPFAAGGFIYIAATDLMPELHKRAQAKVSTGCFPRRLRCKNSDTLGPEPDQAFQGHVYLAGRCTRRRLRCLEAVPPRRLLVCFPPLSKGTNTFNFLILVSFWGLGTTMVLMPFIWNLTYLALATGIMWATFMILGWVYIMKPFVEYRRTIK